MSPHPSLKKSTAINRKSFNIHSDFQHVWNISNGSLIYFENHKHCTSRMVRSIARPINIPPNPFIVPCIQAMANVLTNLSTLHPLSTILQYLSIGLMVGQVHGLIIYLVQNWIGMTQDVRGGENRHTQEAHTSGIMLIEDFFHNDRLCWNGCCVMCFHFFKWYTEHTVRALTIAHRTVPWLLYPLCLMQSRRPAVFFRNLDHSF